MINYEPETLSNHGQTMMTMTPDIAMLDIFLHLWHW